MAGTRKYTQDEINSMTTAERSAAWAGADAASRDALHAANTRDLSGSNTYNSSTGVWTPNSSNTGGSSIADLANRARNVAGAIGGQTQKQSGNSGSDYYADFLREMQTGGDYDTLVNLYNQRVAKTAPGQGYDQYANDDAMQYMRNVILERQAMQPQQVESYTPSAWDTKLNQLAQEAINFNYDDWTKSEQYNALARRYGLQGNATMRDVLGQVSSRTGGLASSYATQVAQQQYNDYMAQLEDVARNQYADEKSSILQGAKLAQTMSEQEYQRWLDEQNRKQNGQSTAISALYNLLDYNTGRDNTAYDREQNAKSEAQNRIYDYLVNQGGKVGNLDADLITKSGYTTAELNQMEQAYLNAQAAAAAKGSGSGSGGSRSSGGSKSSGGKTGNQDYDALFAAAEESGHPKSYIANNYKQYGFTSSSGLYDDFQDWDGGDVANAQTDSGNGHTAYYSNALREINAAAANGDAQKLVDAIQKAIDSGRLNQLDEDNLLDQYGYLFK